MPKPKNFSSLFLGGIPYCAKLFYAQNKQPSRENLSIPNDDFGDGLFCFRRRAHVGRTFIASVHKRPHRLASANQSSAEKSLGLSKAAATSFFRDNHFQWHRSRLTSEQGFSQAIHE
jgi:hypothetical protein